MDFRKATLDDLDVLVGMRMAMREEREEAPCPIDPTEFETKTREYFRTHVPDGRFIAWLAAEDGRVIATSGMCVYDVPPTYGNPKGRIAYLVNMYTLPEHRGRGIASKLVQLLVDEARKLGCGRVTLNTSKAGKHVYENYGFADLPGEMEYFLE